VDELAGRQVGAVANLALALLLAVLPLGSSGTRIDHTEVRPWGCRTCPIHAPPPAGGAAQPGLDPSASGASGRVPNSEW